MNINEKYYCSKCMRELTAETTCSFCGYVPDSNHSRQILEEGTLLQNGRYQLGTVLGAGGFGITYAAWDWALGHPVAIKEYFPEPICARDVWEDDSVIVSKEDEQTYQLGLLRFNREARILAALQNVKSVVTVHDCFEDNHTAYIVMEYVRGKTIDQYVRDNKLDAQQVFDLIRSLVDSLIMIHEIGVLHRDISPSNILVQEDGTLKLIDFGAAVIEERRLQGKDKTVVFNRQFAPIEQFDENGCQGPWTDVYALSATLYYLITGEYPQEALSRKGQDSLRKIRSGNAKLKRWQKKAITEGMAIAPEKRIQSMDHFRSVLYHLPMPEMVKERRIAVLFVSLIAAVVAATLGGIIGILTINSAKGFAFGDGVRYRFQDGSACVVGCDIDTESIVIQEDVLGVPVTEIGEYAFSNSPSLETLELPEDIVNVAYNAFSGCDPDLVVWCTEGSDAQSILQERGVLTAVRDDYDILYNESGAVIADYYGDSKAAQCVIPDYVEGIPITDIQRSEMDWVFGPGLQRVVLPKYLSVLEMGIVNDITTLQHLEMGENLVEIGPSALQGCGAAQMELPESLQKIGNAAFAASYIENIRIPDSVTEIGTGVFASCTELTQIVLPDGISNIPTGMFWGCSSLTDVTLSKNTKIVESYAFAECFSLETLELPDTVECIEQYAFMDCKMLQLIYIPSRVVDIDETAFIGCSSELIISGISDSAAEDYAKKYGFTFVARDQWDYASYSLSEKGGLLLSENAAIQDTVYLPDAYCGIKNQIVKSVEYAENLNSRVVYLPKYAEQVEQEAFKHNPYIKTIYTNNRLQTIKEFAFFDMDQLNTVQLSSGLQIIERFAFAYNENLSAVNLPDTVKDLGMYAFWKCGNLTSIEIPQELTILPDGCFAETGIESIVIPEHIVKCSAAFYGCQSLKEVVLEEGVRTLCGTFVNCTGLESITIPPSVKQISRSTFHGCTALKDIWIYSDDVNMEYIYPVAVYINDMLITEDGIEFVDTELETDEGGTLSLFADCPDVTIHGHAGSAAQAYARAYGINFEVIE